MSQTLRDSHSSVSRQQKPPFWDAKNRLTECAVWWCPNKTDPRPFADLYEGCSRWSQMGGLQKGRGDDDFSTPINNFILWHAKTKTSRCRAFAMSVARSAALNLHDNHVGGMPNGIPSKTRGYRFELAHARMKTRMHEHARVQQESPISNDPSRLFF